MARQHGNQGRPLGRSVVSWLAIGWVGLLVTGPIQPLPAQTPGKPADAATAKANPDQPASDPSAERLRQAEQMAKAALATEEPSAKQSAVPPSQSVDAKRINVLDMLLKGGPVMIPIGLLSVLVVGFSLDRLLGLRRGRVLPRRLMRGLERLASQKDFDPRQAYRLCQTYPSAAANVVRAMLLKIGRPNAEVELAVSEACEREAARLYANVRWLNLAAGVGPLLGLLGTVQGMIQSFFVTANLPVGANRAEYLSRGIYIALVTTFAGLVVAIPAAVLAHAFEGRIQSLFRAMDEKLSKLLPFVERYEGRVRISRDQLEATLAGTAKRAPKSPASEEGRRPVSAPASAPK